MKATVLDTVTGAVKEMDGIGSWHWAEGNWACDCNRNIFGIDVTAGRCDGAQRFLVVMAVFEPGEQCYTLAELNRDYPEELLAAHWMVPAVKREEQVTGRTLSTAATIQHLQKLWAKRSEETRADFRNQVFHHDPELWGEMLLAGMAERQLPEGMTPVRGSQAPEDVVLDVVWGNGFVPWQFGQAKRSHGKWWLLGDANPYANNRECAAPLLFKASAGKETT